MKGYELTTNPYERPSNGYELRAAHTPVRRGSNGPGRPEPSNGPWRGFARVRATTMSEDDDEWWP
jgi:hypothetical protein